MSCANACGKNENSTEKLLKDQIIRISPWGTMPNPLQVLNQEICNLKQLPLQKKKYGCKVEYVTMTDLRNYVGNFIASSLGGMATGSKPIRSTLGSITPELQGILDEYYGQTTASK